MLNPEWAMATGSWNHFAIVRNGNNGYLYVNGVQGQTWDVTGLSIDSEGSGLCIGRPYGNVDNYYLDGWIDEIRLSKGVARWTAAFTPPTYAYVSTFEVTPNITSANAFQAIAWDISAIGDYNKDAIDKIIATVVNADAANTFYIDNMYAVLGGSNVIFFGNNF